MGYDKFAECIELKKQLAAMTKERDAANARIERLREALKDIMLAGESDLKSFWYGAYRAAEAALNTDAEGEPK